MMMTVLVVMGRNDSDTASCLFHNTYSFQEAYDRIMISMYISIGLLEL